jgi:hypothetical protein
MASSVSTIATVSNPPVSVWAAVSGSIRRDSNHSSNGFAARSSPLARFDLVGEAGRPLRCEGEVTSQNSKIKLETYLLGKPAPIF